jgi:Zn-finger nucleic acid-binding protein
MKCPACANELTAKQVGSMTVEICVGGCGGIWFDAFELQRVDDEIEAAGDPLLHIKRDKNIHVDAARRRNCPRCADIKLMRHLFSPKSRVEVDECPNCGGYWLDDGELAKIRAERSPAGAAKKADDSLSTEFIRYLYQARTGHDKDRPS